MKKILITLLFAAIAPTVSAGNKITFDMWTRI